MKSIYTTITLLEILITCNLAYKINYTGASIHFYMSTQFRGQRVGVKLDELVENDCLNVGYELQASSVLSDYCVHLFKARDCDGDYVVIKAGARFYSMLHDFRPYSSYLQSIGACYSTCDKKSLERLLPKNLSATYDINLNDFYNFYGAKVKLNLAVPDCALIPKSLRKKVSGISHEMVNCVELYENWNCSGNSVQVYTDHGLGVQNFDNRAVAISLCGYSCDAWPKRLPGKLDLNGSSDSIIVFSDPGFQGNVTHLNLSDGCVSALHIELESIDSIHIYENCLEVYESGNCSGQGLKLYQNDTRLIDLSQLRLGIQSLQRCQDDVDSDDDDELMTERPIVITLLSIVLVLLVTIVVTSVIIVRLRKANKFLISSNEIEEFLEGNGEDDYHNQPYNEDIEVERSYLEINKTEILGSGEFGIVYKGSLAESEDIFTVAVKTIKPYCPPEYLRAMLREIKTMCYVGEHDRIVGLLGCCTKKLAKGEIFVILEFCEAGSLDKMLKNQRNIMQENDVEKPSKAGLNNRLLGLAIQIAEGLEYLAQKNVIHGDIAARNILLDSKFRAKITDFGLSKQLYTNSEYMKKSKCPLPWRHLAFETLKHHQFSIQSDIWAFGVTLWEIFSLGDVPYPGRTVGDGFCQDLANGLRLHQPEYCTDYTYQLMRRCWKEDLADRIRIREIRIELEDMISFAKPMHNETVKDYIVLE